MNVVPLKPPHTLIRGDVVETIMIGKTKIIIDLSHEINMSDEERKRRKESFEEACWMVADELEARGEIA
jgi:hypothetical protein